MQLVVLDKFTELSNIPRPTKQLDFRLFYTLLTNRREYFDPKVPLPNVTEEEQNKFERSVALFKNNINPQGTESIIVTAPENYCVVHFNELGGGETTKTQYRMYCTLPNPNDLLDNLDSLVEDLKLKNFTGQFKFPEHKKSLLTRRDPVVFYTTSIEELVKAHGSITTNFPKTQFDYGVTVGENRLSYHQFLANSLVEETNNNKPTLRNLRQLVKLSNIVEGLRTQVENSEQDALQPDPGLV